MSRGKIISPLIALLLVGSIGAMLAPQAGRGALQNELYLPIAIKAATDTPLPASATPTSTTTPMGATSTPTPSATQTPTPSVTPTSSATQTPTPTVTPTTTSEPPLFAIDNGDFEQGVTEGHGWFEYRSYSNRPLIVQSIEGLPVTPRSGEWFAWLGGDHLLGETLNHRSHLIHYDRFILPNGPVYLHAYIQIISEEQPNNEGDCVYDWFFVWVDGHIVTTVPLCELYNTNGWTLGSVDLSHLAGRTVSLEFQVRTDGERTSNIFLDDISFQSTP